VGSRAAPTDCTTCGCCCFSTEADYIRLFAADEARMDAQALMLTVLTPKGRVMRFAVGRCAALDNDLELGRYRCRIYSARPDCCRWLERASGACLAQIDEKQAARRGALPAAAR
jgi:Fe-S-cluster containining protein